MRAWRHFLLIVSLLLAQMLVGAHAIEHAASGDEGLPTHTCPLCVTGHDLGTALPSVASLPPIVLPLLSPEVLAAHDRAAFPAPVATQRGPPAF